MGNNSIITRELFFIEKKYTSITSELNFIEYELVKSGEGFTKQLLK